MSLRDCRQGCWSDPLTGMNCAVWQITARAMGVNSSSSSRRQLSRRLQATQNPVSQSEWRTFSCLAPFARCWKGRGAAARVRALTACCSQQDTLCNMLMLVPLPCFKTLQVGHVFLQICPRSFEFLKIADAVFVFSSVRSYAAPPPPFAPQKSHCVSLNTLPSFLESDIQ